MKLKKQRVINATIMTGSVTQDYAAPIQAHAFGATLTKTAKRATNAKVNIVF